MHSGLKRLFYNLSVASKKVEDRKRSREKLHGYLRKIKIISARSSKQSVIHDELAKLERHLSQTLDKKLHLRESQSKSDREKLERFHKKEQELNEKITRVNEILAKVGKKVNEEKFKKELGKAEKPSMVDKLEGKLYALEARYHKLEENPEQSEEGLLKIKETISKLKEKIREAKIKT